MAASLTVHWSVEAFLTLELREDKNERPAYRGWLHEENSQNVESCDQITTVQFCRGGERIFLNWEMDHDLPASFSVCTPHLGEYEARKAGDAWR